MTFAQLPYRVRKYFAIALMLPYMLSGFFAGASVATFFQRQPIKEWSPGMMVFIAAISIVVSLVGLFMTGRLLRIIAPDGQFFGQSREMWLILLPALWAFGTIMGAMLPSGPFQ